MATYTPEEFNKLLDRFVSGLPEAISRAGFASTQNLNANLNFRIFTGETKSIDGNSRKYRSSSWKKKRKAKELQTNKVDMVFDGDLARSIKIVESKKEWDIATKGNLNIKKISDADAAFKKYTGNTVFEASKPEENRVYDDFDEEINKYINKFFD